MAMLISHAAIVDDTSGEARTKHVIPTPTVFIHSENKGMI